MKLEEFGLRRRANKKPLLLIGGGGLIVFSVFIVFFHPLEAFTLTTFFSSITGIFSFFLTLSYGINHTLIFWNEESCLSRNQSALYRKPSPHKPSSYLIDKLRSYEELHERCGPRTLSYKRSIQQLKSGHHLDDNDSACKYVVAESFQGLGNRILSITAAFLYALLTNRVLLIDHQQSMDHLFCEPFPNTSWILPKGDPVKIKFNTFDRSYNLSFGNLLKSNRLNYSTEELPWYQFLYLSGNAGHHDNLFFCDEHQALLSKIPWLIIKSDLYFVPSLFLISSFEKELNMLFPDKVTILHHLGRYLFHPSDQVWRLITRYYNDYFAKEKNTIGIQIRIFKVKDSPFELVMDQILACTKQEKLLPEVGKKSSTGSTSNKQSTDVSILITSLFKGYSEKLKRMYAEHRARTGEKIEVYQPTHLERQRSSRNGHNMQAWAEIYLLSLSDELVTSAGSTFGYVAQGLRGITPLMLSKVEGKTPDPPCRRDMSMEPCFHKPPYYNCKAKAGVDPATLAPYFRHCHDIRWGIKLVNTTIG